MPRIHDPFIDQPDSTTNGSRSGLLLRGRAVIKRSRHRRKTILRLETTPRIRKINRDDDKKQSAADFMGEDLLDFCTSQRQSVSAGSSEGPAGPAVSPKQIPSHKTELDSTAEEEPPMSSLDDTAIRFTKNHDPVPANLITPFRRALAIDTRCLDTSDGKRVAKSTLEECRAFLRCLVERGLAPCILSWTQLQLPASDKKICRAKRPVIGLHSMHLTIEAKEKIENGIVSQFFSEALIAPPVNSGNLDNRKAVHVPKSMLAHSSWKLFGDFRK